MTILGATISRANKLSFKGRRHGAARGTTTDKNRKRKQKEKEFRHNYPPAPRKQFKPARFSSDEKGRSRQQATAVQMVELED